MFRYTRPQTKCTVSFHVILTALRRCSIVKTRTAYGKVFVQSKLLYGAESWTLKQTTVNDWTDWLWVVWLCIAETYHAGNWVPSYLLELLPLWPAQAGRLRLEALEMWVHRRTVNARGFNISPMNIGCRWEERTVKWKQWQPVMQEDCLFGTLIVWWKYKVLQIILKGKILGRRSRGRRRTISLDNIKWSGLEQEVCWTALS